MPMMTLLQSSSGAGHHLNDLLTRAEKLDVRRLHKVTDAGFEADEYREVLESLRTVAGRYTSDSVDML